jgi:hypothetical protein
VAPFLINIYTQDILLPYPDNPLKRLLIPIFINLIWIAVIFYFIYAHPEILLSGGPIIYYAGHLLIFLPIPVLLLSFRRFFSAQRFSGINTFAELVDVLFTLNLWKYKADNYKRLKVELQEYFDKHASQHGI